LPRLDSVRFFANVPPPSNLSDLSRPELEAVLVELSGKVVALEKVVGEQREEIARLKGLKGRPSIKPSGMDKATEPPKPAKKAKRRFRGKVTPRVSIEDQVVKVAVPEGSRFKGYEPFLVQDLVISAKVTCYQRERWVTPDGRTILAPLPEGIDGHFGPELRRFVLMQYHQGQSTLPRLAKFLRSVGVAISKRQLQRLLTDKQEDFVAEPSFACSVAQDVLRAGLETSPYVSVDRFAKRADVPEGVRRTDTGARHAGKNGFCTQIGNDWFTWFGTRTSKSRLNFLDLLRAQAIRDESPGPHRLRAQRRGLWLHAQACLVGAADRQPDGRTGDMLRRSENVAGASRPARLHGARRHAQSGAGGHRGSPVGQRSVAQIPLRRGGSER
jgi:hypothetical protein